MDKDKLSVLLNELMLISIKNLSNLKVRDEVLNYCCRFGFKFSALNSGFQDMIYKYVENLNLDDAEKCFKKVFKRFYHLMLPPIVGEYYLSNNKFDLAEDEIRFCMLKSLSTIFFIISGRAGQMLAEVGKE